ncbi:MAG: glycosyltransferase family 39 protein [Prolixibacteraceae bacterium]|nr:glycosyltransferase family 39 protein [Prolixibacteraceae bacterium]
MHNSLSEKYSWLIIPIVFLISSAPGALEYFFYYPDEKYYIDSVLQMLDNGDYLTPLNADGTPRFLKPIITYWILTGSYILSGVSKFSSRVMFWLAGALLTALTFAMTKSVTGKRKTAMTAALITASNPLVLMSAGRSIPDILLVLFMTISAFGFLKIMLDEIPEKKYYWMAYAGAAVAFETKGLPAAAFAGISILFLLFNPWQRCTLKKIINFPAMTVAAIIAVSWFAVMYIEHGSWFFSSFYEDQFGERVSSKTIQVITNASAGILNFIAFSVPWIIIAFSRPDELKKYISNAGQKQKAIFGFISIWVIMIFLMSGAVFKFYDRYLLPVIPLSSIFFAIVISETGTKFKKFFLSLFIGMNLCVIFLILSLFIFIRADFISAAGTCLSVLLLIALKFGTFKKLSVETNIAYSLLFLYFNAFILLYPLLIPNIGEQLVDTLKTEQISANDKVYVYGNIRTASNIRVQSHNQFTVVSMDTIYSLPEEPDHFLVFSEKEKPFLNLENYEVRKGSEVFSRIQPEKFPGVLKTKVKKIKEKENIHYVAKLKKN